MLTEEAHEAKLAEEGPWDSEVHVGCTCIPPWAKSVPSREFRLFWAQPAGNEFAVSGSGSLPLTPQDAAQFPSDPGIQFLERRLHLSDPVIGHPATMARSEFLDEGAEITSSAPPEFPPEVVLEPFDRLWGHLHPWLKVRREREAEELPIPRPVHGAFLPIDLQAKHFRQEALHRCHDPLPGGLRLNVDV